MGDRIRVVAASLWFREAEIVGNRRLAAVQLVAQPYLTLAWRKIGAFLLSQLRLSKVRQSDHAALSDEIERALLESLALTNVLSANTSIVLALRNNENCLQGGLTASTSYGWLLIKTLWVAQGLRGQGQGRALMDMAETEGRAIGCHSAWLDTSSPEAHAFYVRLGYEEFGVLENLPGQEPAAHCRWFMKKAL